MSSPRHANPVSETPPPPDVLTEATDLDSLLEAIVGKKSAGAGAPKQEDRSEEPARRNEVAEAPLRSASAPSVAWVPPVAVDRRASFLSATASEVTRVSKPLTLSDLKSELSEVTAAPVIAMSPVEPLAIEAEPQQDEEPAENTPTVHKLRLVRTSPWPIMIIVGGMALVTVSAIGLRSGSSEKVQPPPVASPTTTMPDGYAARLPAAPLTPAEGNLAPPSTAFGDALGKPAATPEPIAPPTVTAPAATAQPPRTTSPLTPRPSTVGAAAKPANSAGSGAAAPASPTSEPTAAAAAPRVEEPAIEPRREVAREPEPTPVTAPKVEAAAPPLTSPPASPARGTASSGVAVNEVVPELPKPAASRTIGPIIGARRLTGAKPEYAAALRQRRVGGVVDVQVRIDLNGHVVSAIAVSGPAVLRQAAEAAVLKWRYAPATRNGIPIETETKVSFSFDPSQNRRP